MLHLARPGRLALILAFSAVLLPLRPAAASDDIEESGASKSVSALLAKDLPNDPREVWRLSAELAKVGKGAIKPLREALAKANAAQRLAVARALELLDDHSKAMEALETLAADDKAEGPLREAAVRVLGEAGELDEADWLAEHLDTTLVPEVKLAMARALWALNRANKGKGKDVMLQFLHSTDADLRAQGALALGEIGAGAEAVSILRELKDEPTERGRSATLLLRILHMQQEQEAALRTGAPPAPAAPAHPGATPPGVWPLLDEMREILRKAYYDPQKVDEAKLEDAAAAGITAALDPYSGYLSPADNARLLESIDPSYGGVGAYVQNDVRNGEAFTISRPIFGGPVDRAGLRSGDVIRGIDGKPTEGLAVEESVRRLRGPAGTKVVVTVFRRGWTETRDFELTRVPITVPTTFYDVLPGKIGFLEIGSFAAETAAEVERILDEFEKQGVEGLVLDLRENGGGLVTSAVQIASQFLPAGTLVLTEKGRPGVWPTREYRSTGPSAPRKQLPLVLLTSQFTASAAEIFAGALQVPGRARLVGSMTFGKGVMQLPLDLQSRPGEPFIDQEHVDKNGNVVPKNGRYDPPEKFTDLNGNGKWDPGEPFVDANGNGRYDEGEPYTDVNRNGRWDPGGGLKFTIAAYYLPDGRHLEGETRVVDGKVTRVGGLAPDVEPKPDAIDLWELQALGQLEKTGQVRTFVDKLFEQDAAGMARLARSDHRDPAAYPGFDAFFATLDTRLSKEAVRPLVRWHVRRRLGDELRREVVGDVVDDHVLRAGLADLFRTLKKDPASEPDLAFLAQEPAKR